MLKENTTVLKDNERFEGYNVDLIEKLSEILGFKYKFKWVYDEKSYGSYFEKTKTWDGMIKEILEGVSCCYPAIQITINFVSFIGFIAEVPLYCVLIM